jgi:hypothetical protein
MVSGGMKNVERRDRIFRFSRGCPMCYVHTYIIQEVPEN